MIRPPVARIDLHAVKSNYRHIVDYVARDGAARLPADRGRQGEWT
jgi:hypothetical protein